MRLGNRAERKGGESRMVGDDLISRKDLMDSLRGNVLIDVTAALEEAIESQPAACDIYGIAARIGAAMGQLEEALGIASE